MPYCTIDKVQALMQFTYDLNTQPTLAQVTDFIEDITAEINVALLKAGVALPVTDSDTLRVLGKYCAYGVAGLAGLSNSQNIRAKEAGTKVEEYLDTYKAYLANIRAYLPATLLPSTPTIANQVSGGIETTPEFMKEAVEEVKF